MKPLDNANPTVVQVTRRVLSPDETDDSVEDAVTPGEIFDLIRDLNDPEHPLTLEQLAVVEEEKISIDGKNVTIEFTPTVPHCSMATLIGLSIRVKLLRSLPDEFKVDVRISPGTHSSEAGINKQLGDKERVAAALENASLIEVVNQCLQERRQDA